MSLKDRPSLGPACPVCGRLAPFIRTQWRREKPFACKGCGTQLVMPRAYTALLVLFVYWFVRDEAQGPAQKIALALGLLAISLFSEWATLKPKPAPPAPRSAARRCRSCRSGPRNPRRRP